MSSTNLLCAGGLATPFHSIPADEALAVLETHYGLTGTLQRLDTEKDDTFRLATPRGERFIAKYSNPDEDPAELSLQADLLDHLARVDPGLPVPRVVHSRDGLGFFTVTDSHGQPRMVRMLTYLEGTPLDRIDPTPEERFRLGATLARLRLAMAGFSHPHEAREIAWDVQHLPKLAFLLDGVTDPDHHAMLAEGMARFRQIEGKLRTCRRQVLHNDFNRSNVVVDRSDPAFVTGVIDFGDALRTYIVIDLSTALLAYLEPEGGPAMFDRGRDLLAGYLSVADLTPDELEVLPHLVMARVIARALITTWRARQFPDNEPYIMRNTHQGWQQLRQFLSLPPDRISRTFAPGAASQAARKTEEARI
ncbi:phosphotransferase [Paracoccus sp. AS002]|uniref:phosphotransferase n=1 Tax=Paracoccus sp. AS002 TaxID=3019545 RepID=UPI0023E835BD|nr:phosphotransferase [Paracoccus sp. AS002]MDF3904087.1 phosphotransferase [Paracoccus sp. AS002]